MTTETTTARTWVLTSLLLLAGLTLLPGCNDDHSLLSVSEQYTSIETIPYGESMRDALLLEDGGVLVHGREYGYPNYTSWLHVHDDDGHLLHADSLSGYLGNIVPDGWGGFVADYSRQDELTRERHLYQSWLDASGLMTRQVEVGDSLDVFWPLEDGGLLQFYQNGYEPTGGWVRHLSAAGDSLDQWVWEGSMSIGFPVNNTAGSVVAMGGYYDDGFHRAIYRIVPRLGLQYRYEPAWLAQKPYSVLAAEADGGTFVAAVIGQINSPEDLDKNTFLYRLNESFEKVRGLPVAREDNEAIWPLAIRSLPDGGVVLLGGSVVYLTDPIDLEFSSVLMRFDREFHLLWRRDLEEANDLAFSLSPVGLRVNRAGFTVLAEVISEDRLVLIHTDENGLVH